MPAGWSSSVAQPLWGLLPAGYAGFLVSLSRDLTEMVATLLLVLILLALRQGRPILAGASWSAGVLTRDTVLLVVVGLALAQVASPMRSRRASRTEVLARLLLAGAAVAMQLIVLDATGAIPATTDTSGNLTRPFAALVHEASLLLHSGTRSALIEVTWLVGLTVVVGLGLASLRHTTASRSASAWRWRSASPARCGTAILSSCGPSPRSGSSPPA